MKCDQKEPECDRCTKANIPCEGYSKDLKFVDEKERAQKRVQIKREAYLQSIQADAERLKARRSLGRRRSSVYMPPELPLSAFREHISVSHMDAKLFAGAKAIAPWSMELYSGRDDCTVTQTIRALGSMYYGRTYHDQESLAQSMIYYSKALRLLTSDLQDSKAIFEISSLSNVLSLCTFEV